MTPAKAREQLQICASALFDQASEKHVEGMALTQQSASVAQLARLATDDQVIKLLDTLIKQGVIFEFNAPGGKA